MSSLLWCFERGLRIALYALEGKKGPHLAMTGEFHGFYQLGCEVGFLSSYDEDLREPLVCPQDQLQRQVELHSSTQNEA